MRARNFLSYLWTIFMIFIVLTWLLWFFGYDIRDLKYKVKDIFSNLKSNIELSKDSQQLNSANNNVNQLNANKEDSLISKCRQSFESCKDIATQKYDMSISLLKVEKFEEKIKAEEFYETWKSPLQMGLETELKFYSNYNTPIESNFPVVLFASKVRGSQGALPTVLICNKEGDLVKFSKQQLLCG